jgi:hypothetical protein
VARPLRGVSTGLEGTIFFGPTVGREIHDPGHGPGRCGLFHLDQLKRRADARATRSGPVRQDNVLKVSLWYVSISTDGRDEHPWDF